MDLLKNKLLFLLMAILLLLAMILTYSNHWSNSFHFDDFHTITDNPYIRDLHNIPVFFTNPQTYSVLSSGGSIRSLCTLSAAIDYHFGHGYNQIYFHLSSFLWYLAQLVFMFILFKTIFNRAFKNDWNNWLALFGVAWYGLHTVNAETINYISARSDLLSTALVIIALVSYIRSPFMRKYLLYLIPFVLGVLAKQSALMFASLLFVYLLFFEEEAFLSAMLKSLPAFLVVSVYFWINVSSASYLVSVSNIPYFNYLISQAFVVLYYFKNFFLPTDLNVDYGWAALSSMVDHRFIFGLLFIILMSCVAYFCSVSKKYRPIAFGVLWFFIALAPTSLAPLTEILNDHRVFFPYVGLMMAVCWAIGLIVYKYEQQIREKLFLKGIIILLCLLVLLANALGTWDRNKVWKDEESLWYDVTIKSPQNGRGLMNYGLTQMAKGKYDVALEYFNQALKYTPRYTYLYTNLGVVYGAINDPKKAEDSFLKALEFGPDNYAAFYHYGKWLAGQGRQKEAILLLIRSSQLSPGFLLDRYLLINIYDSMGKKDLAKAQALNILKIDPSDNVALQYLRHKKILVPSTPNQTPEYYLTLSLTNFNRGLFNECISAAQAAIKLRPNYAEAYNNIGAAYNSMGQWDNAIVALEKALAIKPDFQLAKNNLALANQRKAMSK